MKFLEARHDLVQEAREFFHEILYDVADVPEALVSFQKTFYGSDQVAESLFDGFKLLRDFVKCRFDLLPRLGDLLLDAVPGAHGGLFQLVPAAGQRDDSSHRGADGHCDARGSGQDSHDGLQCRCDLRQSCQGRTAQLDRGSDAQQQRSGSSSEGAHHHEDLFHRFAQVRKTGRQLLDPLHEALDEGQQDLTKLDPDLRQRRFEDRDLSGKVVVHGVGHVLCSAGGIVDILGQVCEFLIRSVHDGQQAGHAVLAGKHRRVLRFLCLRQSGKLGAQVLQQLGQGLRLAVGLRDADAQLLHGLGGLLCGLGQPGEHAAQRGAGLACLDAAVGHQADGDGDVLIVIAQGAGERCDVFERLTHHAHVRVADAGRLRQHVGEFSGVCSTLSERGQRVGHDVRRSAQLLAGGGGQVHDALKAVHHFLGVPAGHGHVFQGLAGLRRAEFRRHAHLAGLFAQRFQVLRGSAGDRGHLRHLGFKVGSGFHRHAKTRHDRRRHPCGQGLADVRDVRADGFHLLTNGLDLLRGDGAEGLILFFQPFQPLLGVDDLPLKCVPLFRSDAFLLHALELGEPVLRALDGCLQLLLLLHQERRVAGVQLQQLVDVLEGARAGRQLLVDLFELLGKF